MVAEGGEHLAPQPVLMRRKVGQNRLALQGCRVQHIQRAIGGIHADDIAIGDAGNRPAIQRLETWIAAGTLPDAPDMRPSVTSATLSPRSCNTLSSGVRL